MWRLEVINNLNFQMSVINIFQMAHKLLMTYI
jgi:hypothetical protein